VSRLKASISMSLDGFAAGPEQSAENPLGIGGMALHEWAVPLRAFRESHGEEGGEEDASTPIIEERFENVGASIMGRNMFGGGPGPWGEDPWTGWWGDEPPFHHPVFVLTHHSREPLELSDTTFHFVTDGIEPALDRAREAAAGRDVSLGGGASAVQQYLTAGLLDEIIVSVVPVFLGGGAPLFDGLAPESELEQAEVIPAPRVTHIRYRLARR
jgi:dihydrofolate reductase